VNENLLHVLRLNVNILNLLWHNVFSCNGTTSDIAQLFIWLNFLTLAELENVLFAVDDLEGSVGQPLTNVTGMMPALRVYRGCCAVLILEVSGKTDKTLSEIPMEA
jgi:hypothetical protein